MIQICQYDYSRARNATMALIRRTIRSIATQNDRRRRGCLTSVICDHGQEGREDETNARRHPVGTDGNEGEAYRARGDSGILG